MGFKISFVKNSRLNWWTFLWFESLWSCGTTLRHRHQQGICDPRKFCNFKVRFALVFIRLSWGHFVENWWRRNELQWEKLRLDFSKVFVSIPPKSSFWVCWFIKLRFLFISCQPVLWCRREQRIYHSRQRWNPQMPNSLFHRRLFDRRFMADWQQWNIYGNWNKLR